MKSFLFFVLFKLVRNSIKNNSRIFYIEFIFLEDFGIFLYDDRFRISLDLLKFEIIESVVVKFIIYRIGEMIFVVVGRFVN